MKTGQLPADLLIPDDDTAATVNEEDSNQMDVDNTTSKTSDKSKPGEESRTTDSPIPIDEVSFQYILKKKICSKLTIMDIIYY